LLLLLQLIVLFYIWFIYLRELFAYVGVSDKPGK